ncbi:MAG: pilus assembly PilX N-terminal domain-containing protein [Acidobacteria bacterium]|nr:pilus assembly PilX N-terminal domain-containing protein [Acidobacteriota bacterium]
MPRSNRAVHDERGTALLIAIMLVLMFAAIGAAVSIASRTEMLIAANFRQSREALYAAEGAMALAVRDLGGIADWSAVLSGAVASSFTDGAAIGTRTLPGGDTVALCCAAPSLTADLQQRAHGDRSWGVDTPQWLLFAWGPASGWLPAGRVDSPIYVAVWVADDTADNDGNPAADSNGLIELHAQALAPGGGRRVVEVLAARQNLSGGAPIPGLRILSWRDVRW